MKPFKITIALTLLLIFCFSCAKSKVSIGGGDVEKEYQSCLSLTEKGDYEEAIQCMEMFKARYPQTPQGQEAMLRIGDAQFAKKEYLLAAESYQAFLRLYPMSSKADYAHYRTGVAYYKESPKATDRDQGYLDEAIASLRTVLIRYPSSAYAELSRATLHVAVRRIAKRAYYIGNFYYRTGEYLAAIPRFKEVADTFADSGLADKALYKIVDANLKLGRIDDAKTAFSQLSTKYASSKFTKKAEKKLLSKVK